MCVVIAAVHMFESG